MDTVLIGVLSFLAGYLSGRVRTSPDNAQIDSTQIQLLERLPDSIEAKVRSLYLSGRKIEALKELRQASGLGLKEAKNIIDLMAGGKSLREIINNGPSTAGDRPSKIKK